MIKGIFRSLVKAKKTVYTRIGFECKSQWRSVFEPNNTSEYQTKIFDPLVKFLKEFGINGIFIDVYSMYCVSKIGKYNFLLNLVLSFEYYNNTYVYLCFVSHIILQSSKNA